MRAYRLLPTLFVGLLMLACAHSGPPQRSTVGVGSDPALPAPQHSMVPTVHIAKAAGWPEGAAPKPAAGLKVTPFARDLQHPRWLLVLPNGDVLVAETNAPPKPEDAKGLKGMAMKVLMKRAGAQAPSANRITLLRDADGDGVAETRSVLLEGLNSPFGMALVGQALYVANTDAVLRFPYAKGDTRITAPGTRIVDLPGGPLNHHWTKNLIANADGSKLYVTVGSNSNVAENGMDKERERAAIWEVDVRTGAHRLFATGLRNPNGLAWEPRSNALWTVVNERDELGDDLVPDYLTAVKDGAFYGWPYSYWGTNIDKRVTPQREDLIARATKPDYGLGSHVAALGLAWSDARGWPQPFAGGGMFIGEHGSWNRKPFSGYEVVFIPFRDGRPNGMPVEALSGFISADGDAAYGRPVGVAVDARGALLVADDVGNAVWRVSP